MTGPIKVDSNFTKKTNGDFAKEGEQETSWEEG